jgi:hypothetical protein
MKIYTSKDENRLRATMFLNKTSLAFVFRMIEKMLKKSIMQKPYVHHAHEAHGACALAHALPL